MNEYYVYILKCANDSYYTGVTNNLERRFKEHETGVDTSSYTYSRRPFKVHYVAVFQDVNEAIAFEKQVKGWSRKKKEALAEHDTDALKRLSECRNKTHSHYYSRNSERK